MYHLSQKINSKFDAVWQCGIAGIYTDKLKLGEAVWVERDRFADLGVNESTSFQSVFSMELAQENDFPYQQGWLINSHRYELLSGIKSVSANTVNMLTTDEEIIHRISWHDKVDIETMEGASLHYYCLMEQIPFLQIRGISNKVGIRDKQQWQMQEAIQSSNALLIRLYQQIALS
jgi:futalosine hydrolase